MGYNIAGIQSEKEYRLRCPTDGEAFDLLEQMNAGLKLKTERVVAHIVLNVGDENHVAYDRPVKAIACFWEHDELGECAFTFADMGGEPEEQARTKLAWMSIDDDRGYDSLNGEIGF
jgi:hypothetical protein